MTKTDKLAIAMDKIYAEHTAEVEALSLVGPRGGHNAFYIRGWAPSPNSTISKVARAGGLRIHTYWKHGVGGDNGCSVAIPECVAEQCLTAYKNIFEKETK